jgi:hypothetical protein
MQVVQQVLQLVLQQVLRLLVRQDSLSFSLPPFSLLSFLQLEQELEQLPQHPSLTFYGMPVLSDHILVSFPPHCIMV